MNNSVDKPAGRVPSRTESAVDHVDPAQLTEVITIDGPAGAGKSSVAREVARRLDFDYLDTGAMYRAATWWGMHCGADFTDPDAVAECVRKMPLRLDVGDDTMRVFVGDHEVTTEIRSPGVTERIRSLDNNPQVRAELVERQRAFAAHHKTVADGRDLGTVVFPHAKCKIFLEASVDERARRRVEQYAREGVEVNIAELREALERRDAGDRNRTTAPLKKADDAVEVDTTHLSFDEVVERVLDLARERI